MHLSVEVIQSLSEKDLVLETFNLSMKQPPFFETGDEVSTRKEDGLLLLAQVHPGCHKSDFPWRKVHRRLKEASLFFTSATRVSLMDEIFPTKALLQSSAIYRTVPLKSSNKLIALEQAQRRIPLKTHTHAH